MEFHIRCEPEDIARYVFAPPDHECAQKIAEHFEDARLVSDTRGYMVYTGKLDGIPMTVWSTGIGGPQVGIGIEELGHMGADTFIRISACGTLQDGVRAGDLVVPTGVFRGGATTNSYLAPPFPAAPNWQMLTALVGAARAAGPRVHVGVGWATDAIYATPEQGLVEKLKQAGTLSVDMESDTFFIISNARGWRTAAIFACNGTTPEVKTISDEQAFRAGEDQAIQVALAAMKRIARADAEGQGVGG